MREIKADELNLTLLMIFNEWIQHFLCVEQPELVTKYGYPLEIHDIVTKDGYALQLHRIPRDRDDEEEAKSRMRTPILLVHGLGSSSADWVLMGPGKSLGKSLLMVLAL